MIMKGVRMKARRIESVRKTEHNRKKDCENRVKNSRMERWTGQL